MPLELIDKCIGSRCDEPSFPLSRTPHLSDCMQSVAGLLESEFVHGLFASSIIHSARGWWCACLFRRADGLHPPDSMAQPHPTSNVIHRTSLVPGELCPRRILAQVHIRANITLCTHAVSRLCEWFVVHATARETHHPCHLPSRSLALHQRTGTNAVVHCGHCAVNVAWVNCGHDHRMQCKRVCAERL
jgi:hypothetical protein